MIQRYIIFFILFFIPQIIFAQDFFRIKADFSIKTKLPDGKQYLTMGTVYYDKTVRTTVYQIRFPEKEIWVNKDTNMYKIIDNKIISRQSVPAVIEFSIFHLTLNGNLADYGLKKTSFTIEKTEKDKGMVITTWKPPANFAKRLGKIMVSNQDKKLQGIIFFNPAGTIISKQFFKKYFNSNGLEFPSEIVQINYTNGKEGYELTTYSKILVNDLNEENIYNYRLPK